ncbi:MAG: flavin reductase family protein [Candidatus Aenigmarchaeota archaeon]|nr:flavin reductase family protein [Candidatus Aenigmarchaeota archaeon]MCX8191118.1 flavin reductase family protein [Candidatus Aenigmarchaeota archaeon]MDW8160405.1 flavin reductase family protein [Candidatus Aenigmarchaeota archaeon]
MRISEQIFPRVVALVVTISKENKPNVMTASFLMPVSFEPKFIAFAISPQRYSFKNLQEVGEFTVNICKSEMKEQAIICGSLSGKDKNKFELAKLEVENSKKVKPPVVKNSPISFECKVEFMKEFGDHFLIVGRVVEEHIREKEFKPLLHKSGSSYLLL